jgi:transcriptional regulator with XRE-family HTH domain
MADMADTAGEPEAIAMLRRALGNNLVVFRRGAGLTQADIAKATSFARPTVSHIEKGRRGVGETFWRIADERCQAGGALLAGYHELQAKKQEYERHSRQTERAAARTKADRLRAATPPAASSGFAVPVPPQQSHVVQDSHRLAVARNGELPTPVDLPGAEAAPGVDHGLIVGMSLAAWNHRKPANESYVELVRVTSQQLIQLDSQWGGIDIAALANRVFRVVRQRIASGGYVSEVERDLYAAAAELAEVAGWIAFDAEKQSIATGLNHEALYLARLAGDRDIEHLTLLNASMQAGHLRHNSESIVIAQSVIDNGRISPRVHAMSLIRQGRAHSRSGNRADALRALNQAHSLFLDGLSDRDPAWAWWIDAHEIEGQYGAAYVELGDHRRGIPLLHNVVSTTNKGGPRYRIVFTARLLRELVAVSDWREAQHVAEDLAGYTAGIGSARAITLLEKTAKKVDKRPGVPSTFRDTIHHITSEH